MDALDIVELTSLLSQSSRPAVRALLESALKTAAAPPAPSPAPAPHPLPVSAPAPAPALERWVTPRYSYEQDNTHLTLLVFDLPPMTPEVRAGGACTITAASVSLCIPHPGAPGGAAGFRLLVEPLEKEINVAESSFKFKKTQVEVKLRKRTAWEHWTALMGKKRGGGGAVEAEKDPGAGLMDMMKDMYNDGTPEMKKVIAEAWEKSRAGGGSGGGGGGGGGIDF
jgi:hypothetical protein